MFACGGRSTLCIPPGQAAVASKSDIDVATASVVTCAASWDGHQVPLSIPALLDDHELCAANVSFLLKTFKENTVTIFRFCLLEKRVLFLGRSAPAWVTCKMVSPLLITVICTVALPSDYALSSPYRSSSLHRWSGLPAVTCFIQRTPTHL
jgi:hypothetical protein